jgi:hypothetical protein
VKERESLKLERNFFYFFDMSAQRKGERGFELVTSTS